jgi:hypothetical protein
MAKSYPVLAVASLEGALLALVSGQEIDHPLAALANAKKKASP